MPEWTLFLDGMLLKPAFFQTVVHINMETRTADPVTQNPGSQSLSERWHVYSVVLVRTGFRQLLTAFTNTPQFWFILDGDERHKAVSRLERRKGLCSDGTLFFFLLWENKIFCFSFFILALIYTQSALETTVSVHQWKQTANQLTHDTNPSSLKQNHSAVIDVTGLKTLSVTARL